MFGNILKKLRTQKGFTQSELANCFKMSSSAIAMYESGKRMPDYDTMIAFADFFNVDINYLYERSSGNPIRIPVLGKVAAGIPIEAITDILDYEEISSDMIKDGSEYFALQIKGHSMEPKISNGDVVIVRKQEDCDSGQIAIVCINGDEATCKKVMKQPGGILLVPFNPSFEATFYTNQQIEEIPIRVFGRVVECRAKF